MEINSSKLPSIVIQDSQYPPENTTTETVAGINNYQTNLPYEYLMKVLSPLGLCKEWSLKAEGWETLSTVEGEFHIPGLPNYSAVVVNQIGDERTQEKLLLKVSYHPFWHAYIDGEETEGKKLLQ